MAAGARFCQQCGAMAAAGPGMSAHAGRTPMAASSNRAMLLGAAGLLAWRLELRDAEVLPPAESAAPWRPLCSPWPAASTPTRRTPASARKGWKIPIAFDPPPTHATIASGSRPAAARICSRASIPITRWKSRTIVGYGCGPITEPMQ